MRDLFARLVGVKEPIPSPPAHGYPGYPDALSRGSRETFNEINADTPDTLATPEIRLQPYALDDADRLDALEERAAILEFDGHLSRSEAERRAWADVFGTTPPEGFSP